MGSTIVMQMTVAIALVMLLAEAMQTAVATFLPGYGNEIGYATAVNVAMVNGNTNPNASSNGNANGQHRSQRGLSSLANDNLHFIKTLQCLVSFLCIPTTTKKATNGGVCIHHTSNLLLSGYCRTVRPHC